MMDMMLSSATTNNLTSFKKFLESGGNGIQDLVTEIRYLYSTPLNIYKADLSDGIFQINPNHLFDEMFEGMGMTGNATMATVNVWNQLTANRDLLESQYEVLDGRFPSAWNEVVLVVDENNRITDFTLYSLGLLDADALKKAMQDTMAGKEPELDTTILEYTYDDFIGLQFKLLPSSDYYQEENGVWVDKSQDEVFLSAQLQKAENITVVGILRPTSDASMASAGVIGYTGELMTHLIDMVNNSAIVTAQKNDPTVDVFSGLPFADPDEEPKQYTMAEIEMMLPAMPEESQTQLNGLISMMRAQGKSDEEIAATISRLMASATSNATYDGNLSKMGVSDLEKPTMINIYPKDFEAKDAIAQIIEDYNNGKEKDDQIIYTDMVGLMMSSVTTIVNAISYILIAFVGISLVVSSIMIGIITNISVLERTKEIGILRAVGASKKDISRVFNAETFIVGLAAGLVGILITELLLLPTNFLIHTLAELDATAVLHPLAALFLIAVSVGLTLIAGLIPSRNAANKDPVVALRTE
jgi:putative ABC transport system permease protein